MVSLDARRQHQKHRGRRWQATLLLIAASAMFAVAGCGDTGTAKFGERNSPRASTPDPSTLDPGAADPNDPNDPRRPYANFEDRTIPEEVERLGHGEALPGLHLRPGIRVLTLDEHQSQYVTIDPSGTSMRLSGPALDEFKRHKTWTGDIIMGADFIFNMIDGELVSEDDFVLQIKEFSLLDNVHGEWSISLGPEADEAAGDLDSRRQGLGTSLTFSDLLRGADLEVSADVKRSLDLRGSLSFPTSWDGDFRGKVSRLDLNRAYECESYVESGRRNFIGRWWHGTDTWERTVQPEEFCIDYVLVKASIGVDAHMGWTLTAEGTLSAKLSKEHTFGELRAVLPSTPFAIYFVPALEYGVELSAKGKTVLEFDSWNTISIPLGFEYIRDEGDFSVLPNERHAIEKSSRAEKNAGEAAGAEVKLYGQYGMKMELANAVVNKGLKLTGPNAGSRITARGVYEPYQRTTREGAERDPCLMAELYLANYAEAKLRGEIDITSRWKWGMDFTGTIGGEFARTDLWGWKSTGDDFCMPGARYPDLDVRVSWSTDVDLDLYVKTPAGETIYYRNRDSSDGGRFNGDACIHNECDGMNAESVSWDAPPAPGVYEVWVQNYRGGSQASYTIEVSSSAGTIQTFNGRVSSSAGANGPRHTFNIFAD